MIDDRSHIRGLHHVTAIASGAQANVDFYTRVLGLRLVKRTVNFDAPDTYHFYYGNGVGSPGGLLGHAGERSGEKKQCRCDPVHTRQLIARSRKRRPLSKRVYKRLARGCV